MKNLIALFLLLTMLCSCVGTVSESSDPFTESSIANDIPLNFLGVHSVQAISDTRIEVFFYPATGGSGKYTYDVFVGNEVTPRTYSSDTLVPDYQGRLKVTIKNLDRMANYQFKVEVRDEGSSQTSNSRVVKSVQTFSNEVARFDGLQSVSNLPGQDGKDSLRLRWNPADVDSGLTPKPWEPASYEIVVLDALKFLPSDFDVAAEPSQGRWVYNITHADDQLETVVRGLPSKTKFYVRMRSLHLNSVDSYFNPRLRGEQNSNYITISTLSGSLSDLIFNPESFTVALSPGMQGLNAVTASWAQAQGVFDHFRLYYWKRAENDNSVPTLPDVCLNPSLATPSTNVLCKKVHYSLNLTSITGLDAYSDYGVALVLCATSACSAAGDRLVSTPVFIKTDPLTSSFSGINEIVAASRLSEVGSVTITYSAPNFTNGYFDGLILKLRRAQDPAAPVEEILEVSESTSSIYYLPYDFMASTKITVKGLDYLSTEPYCFTLYSYKWNSSFTERIEFPNDIWKCPTLNIAAPKNDEFLGLDSAISYNDTVSVNWKTPLKGIYSHYELYWNKNSATFNWGDAIAQVANGNFSIYNKKSFIAQENAPDSINSASVNLLETGTYKLGMITYYHYITPSGSFEIRSETNPKILTCIVDNNPPYQQRECH